jgi:hypothetical protein
VRIVDGHNQILQTPGRMLPRHRNAGAHHHTGLTLIEVLISIFVLAIGLLGVAALLPVGQHQVQVGAVNQRTTDLSARAFETIRAHGLNDPTRWITLDTQSTLYHLFDAVNPVTRTRVACPVVGTATDGSVQTNPALLQNVSLLADPAYATSVRCCVEFTHGNIRGVRRRPTTYDPATGTFTFSGGAGKPDAPLPAAPNSRSVFVVFRNDAFAVDPYFVSIHGNEGNEVFAQGVPRVTLSRSEHEYPPFPMGYAEAESVFVTSDEEVYEKPADRDEPPRQLFISEPFVDTNGNGVYDSGVDTFDASTHDLNGNGVWDRHRRQFHGNFSWVVTFIPAEGDIYTGDFLTSVAIYYKRNIQLPKDFWTIGKARPTQWGVDLKFLSSGQNFGGGYATLSSTNPFDIYYDLNRRPDYQPDSDRVQIKSGQWILVSNRQRGAEVEQNMKPSDLSKAVYRWYRISAVGEPYEDPDDYTRTNVDVRLVGPDWDTDTIPALPQDTNHQVFPLDASGRPTYMGTIHRDVVGVFQRPMQIVSLPPGAAPRSSP